VIDAPRTLSDPVVLDDRHDHLDDAHVAPLNEWVRDLRRRLGPEAIVPWFDPADGGVDATILWLLEAPGPKATRERGGSGLISCNNNDTSAETAWRTRSEAGVDRTQVIHWNVVPYYLGSATRIRAWTPGDVADAGPMLSELIALLPRLRVVILGGAAAQRGWRDHAPLRSDLVVIDAPHPSPTNVNTRPGTREAIVDAWRRAGDLASGHLDRRDVRGDAGRPGR
jgi:hypothetical protein